MDNQNLNYQNVNGTENIYTAQNGQDPLLSEPVMPQKKKVSKAEMIVSIVVTVVLFRLFGLLGAAICYGGYAVIRAITRSTKLQKGAKIALSILVGAVFLVILFVYIIFISILLGNI